MNKEQIKKEDGRNLYYYTFEDMEQEQEKEIDKIKNQGEEE